MTGSVLIVEDDMALRRSLHETMAALDLTIGEAATGEAALRELEARAYQVALLDLNMPGMGGMSTCRAMRRQHPSLGIIVLTVRDADGDKIKALNAGADDYVTKPFHLPELIARIGAALSRSNRLGREDDGVVAIGPIVIDRNRHTVTKNGANIHLTPTEFDLLQALMASAGRPLAHRSLLTKVWGPEYGDEREYLRTYVNQLRKKLEDDPSHPKYLITDAYVGYRFVESET